MSADQSQSFDEHPRSPLMMAADDTAVLVVDVQDKLVDLIQQSKTIVWNIRRMLDAAKTMEMFVTGTEQYPRGLGSMTAELAKRIPQIPEKIMFSCRGCDGLFEQFQAKQLRKILVCGIETHVCIQQTVLDLLANGYVVYIAADAVGSRHTIDRDIALRRMETSGATITTTEAAIFEWCIQAGSDRFKQLSKLIQEPMPG